MNEVKPLPVFITLEGIDGSGKSLHFRLLVEYLRSKEYDFIATREPGGTPLGERIRELLLDPAYPMTVHSEAFLYAAARSELTLKVIWPALRAGRNVVSDRYVDSSLAYQAFGRGLPPEFVAAINEMGTGGLKPHRTILLDLPVEVAMERKAAGPRDRMEQMDAEFFERVRAGYLELAAAEPRRVKVVDATRPVEVVQAEIRRLVEEIWPRPRRDGSGPGA